MSSQKLIAFVDVMKWNGLPTITHSTFGSV
jgi:hypothetical protein